MSSNKSEAKYTVITGASAGIGEALAYKFASEGHNLILTARRFELLELLKVSLIKEYDIDVILIPADLGNSEALEKLYTKTKDYAIDVFINNAGLGDYSYAWDLNLAKANSMIDVNIKALSMLSLKFIQDYIDEDSTLINVSSGGGYFVLNKAVTYCATKFFVSSFTEGVAQNLKHQNKRLRVKVLAPAGTNTEFVSIAEQDAGFKGADIFDTSAFISAELLAEHAYKLFKSDKIVGIVKGGNEFELRDPIFPYGG